MSSADLIEEALTSGQAFALPPTPKEATYAAVAATTPEPGAPNAIISESEFTDITSPPAAEPETWKEEYDAQVEAWRAQSAEAREKAEAERAKWEAIRKEEKAQRRASGVPEVKEEIPTGLPTHKPPVVANPKDEVETPAIEKQGPASVQPESHEGSQTWEAVEASTASFPSLSFPDQPTQALSPSAELGKPSQRTSTQTTTLAIFDDTLSTRTRALALLSSLAINLALPFVNGVMLGFGEIFAKNVVMEWLGWKQTTTPVASNVGLGTSQRRSIFKS